MTWKVPRHCVICFYGTSLTTGRLSTYWVERLALELRGVPEALAPPIVINLGKGSQTSDWGRDNAYTIATKRPDVLITEDFTINDCFETSPGVTQVSPAAQLVNMQSIHDEVKAANAACDIIWQSMSSVDATVATARTTLAARYAAGGAKALAMGDRWVDNYAGGNALPIPPGIAGGWIKPLPTWQSNPQVPFVDLVTDGYEPIHTGTLNAADKSASIDLTGGDLTATANANAVGAVRGAVAITGTKHFEFTITSAVGITPNVGVANAGANLAQPVGFTANSLGILLNGDIKTNNAVVGNAGFVLVNGDVIAIEVDRPNNLAYFRKGAIRSAGFDISAIAGDLFPIVGLSSAGASVVANLTQQGDGLHPLQSLTDLYLLPNAKFAARGALARFYGLPAPIP